MHYKLSNAYTTQLLDELNVDNIGTPCKHTCCNAVYSYSDGIGLTRLCGRFERDVPTGTFRSNAEGKFEFLLKTKISLLKISSLHKFANTGTNFQVLFKKVIHWEISNPDCMPLMAN